ncbi:MAG: GNAT family N-acetyltransferase [Anaerolineae bacterium]|nr:GNAT family N-acetyltransferase [Anaerolineae bacterium]
MPNPLSDRYVISTDPDRLDIGYIHAFLSQQSYWATNRPYEVVERSVRNSLCFGLYDTTPDQQVGLARVVTDHATFGYLADVFIDPGHRGKGLGKMLVEHVVTYPEFASFKRLLLATRDADSLYAQFGFESVNDKPYHIMEIIRSR